MTNLQTESPPFTDLPEEHPLTIDMDEYPYVVEEIQDKRTQDDTGLTEYLVKWFGFGQ
jgi:Chromo (CHRromatin Organisation MOdifier) domain